MRYPPVTAAAIFDLMHRIAGAAHQVLERLRVSGVAAGYSDRNGDLWQVRPGNVSELVWRGFAQMLGPFRCRHMIRAVHPDRELIAAETGDKVSGAERLAQHDSGASQHLVTGVVTHSIVDHLEIVQIGEH